MTALPSPRFPDPSDAPVLRWGVLAPGSIAHDFVSAVQQHTGQQVVAAASRRLFRAQQFAKEFGIARAYGSYEELVADPEVDIVYIAATHNAHEELALLAISAGKPVLVEKPIATSAESAHRIADAARVAGVFAMEAMWTRYLPHMDVARQLLADGALGPVELVAADFGFPAEYDPLSRMFDPALAGGALLDLGVYTVSFAQFALPSLLTASTVHAYGRLARTGVDAQSTLVLETDGGAQAVLSTSLFTATPQAASISGREGRIDVASPFWAPSDLLFSPQEGEPAEYLGPRGIRGRDGFAFEAAAVARYVAEGRTESPLHGLNEAVAALRILDEARRQLGAR